MHHLGEALRVRKFLKNRILRRIARLNCSLLVERNGTYGRMAVVSGRGLVFVCQRDRQVIWRQSQDAGVTWSEARTLARWDGGHLANPELLALEEGVLLCFLNRRPDPNSGHPYAIVVSRLEEGSKEWAEASVVYTAGSAFGDGCWEPAAVRLPSGEIQLFFANEGPYRESDEQEISLLRSRDGGRTWGGVERVGFRAGHRDGMPVPVLLADGGVAVAIEDNGLSGSFKPVILYTSRADAWRSGTVTGASAARESALAEPLPAQTYAGAPYLRQMPGGETILSFQRSDDGTMAHSRIVVAVGDSRARKFAGLTEPFPPTPGAAQLWASLFVKDDRTVLALATVTLEGVRGVWSVEGRLHRAP